MTPSPCPSVSVPQFDLGWRWLFSSFSPKQAKSCEISLNTSYWITIAKKINLNRKPTHYYLWWNQNWGNADYIKMFVAFPLYALRNNLSMRYPPRYSCCLFVVLHSGSGIPKQTINYTMDWIKYRLSFKNSSKNKVDFFLMSSWSKKLN